MLRPGGTYYLVGYGGTVTLSTMQLVLGEITVVGNLIGTNTDLADLMALATRAKSHSIPAAIPSKPPTTQSRTSATAGSRPGNPHPLAGRCSANSAIYVGPAAHQHVLPDGRLMAPASAESRRRRHAHLRPGAAGQGRACAGDRREARHCAGRRGRGTISNRDLQDHPEIAEYQQRFSRLISHRVPFCGAGRAFQLALTPGAAEKFATAPGSLATPTWPAPAAGSPALCPGAPRPPPARRHRQRKDGLPDGRQPGRQRCRRRHAHLPPLPSRPRVGQHR